MSDRPLRFPPIKEALSVRIKVQDIPGVVARLRRELADLLRETAATNPEPVRAALLEAADIFEEGTDAADPKAPRQPTPIGQRKRAGHDEDEAGGE